MKQIIKNGVTYNIEDFTYTKVSKDGSDIIVGSIVYDSKISIHFPINTKMNIILLSETEKIEVRDLLIVQTVGGFSQNDIAESVGASFIGVLCE